jgi:mono/diheme cytochrome c family protein
MTRVASRALLAVCLAAVGLGGCSERIGRGWDWNRMRNQPRYEPYRRSAFFADGKAMQRPPAGTVSREDGAAATRSYAPTPDVIARGAARYHIYCAVCHGERGDGVSVVASNMQSPTPPSLVTPPISLLTEDSIASVVARGMGPMPPFAAELSRQDRYAVAVYVSTLQHGSAAPPKGATPVAMDSAQPRMPSR